MMKKQHGPAFRQPIIELSACSVCRGKAFTKGVFHDLACVHCNASGWVEASTGYPLSLEALVTQLSVRLQAANLQLAQFRKVTPIGAAQQYEQNNRRGPGGSNYTGD